MAVHAGGPAVQQVQKAIPPDTRSVLTKMLGEFAGEALAAATIGIVGSLLGWMRARRKRRLAEEEAEIERLNSRLV